MKGRPSARLKALHSSLCERIEGEVWPVGEVLPPARVLAQQFGCSVGMVSKAIAMLVHDGLVEQRPRVGTRVISSSAQAPESARPVVELDAFAFIHPSDQHEGGWQTSMAFQKAAARCGRRVITLSAGVDFKKELEFVCRLDEFDVQAAAIFPILLTPQDHIQFAKMVAEAKFPIVLVDHCPAGVDCPSVHLDCFHAGYTVTRHLLDQGVRRIGFLTNNALRASGRSRHQGYVWAMKEFGLEPDLAAVMFESTSHPDFSDPFREPVDLGAKYLASIKDMKVEAVVCSNDVLAIGLLRAARQIGIRIPEDLKVVGIDDLKISSTEEVALTTYRPPFEELGCRSFESLDVCVSGGPLPHMEQSLRGELIVRKSG